LHWERLSPASLLPTPRIWGYKIASHQEKNRPGITRLLDAHVSSEAVELWKCTSSQIQDGGRRPN